MGYPDEGGPAPTPGPIIPRVSALTCKSVITLCRWKVSKDATLSATSVHSCMCGCGGGACIPQREYYRQLPNPPFTNEVILFSVNGKCGYPLGEALEKQYTGLDGSDDKMFVDSGSSISMRLEVGPIASA